MDFSAFAKSMLGVKPEPLPNPAPPVDDAADPRVAEPEPVPAELKRMLAIPFPPFPQPPEQVPARVQIALQITHMWGCKQCRPSTNEFTTDGDLAINEQALYDRAITTIHDYLNPKP